MMVHTCKVLAVQDTVAVQRAAEQEIVAVAVRRATEQGVVACMLAVAHKPVGRGTAVSQGYFERHSHQEY